jgi:hypothetical protein
LDWKVNRSDFSLVILQRIKTFLEIFCKKLRKFLAFSLITMIRSPLMHSPIHVTSKSLQASLHTNQTRNPLVVQINSTPFSTTLMKVLKLNESEREKNHFQGISPTPENLLYSLYIDFNSIAHNRIIELSNGSEWKGWMRKDRRAKFPHHPNDIIANWNIEKISAIFLIFLLHKRGRAQ